MVRRTKEGRWRWRGRGSSFSVALSAACKPRKSSRNSIKQTAKTNRRWRPSACRWRLLGVAIFLLLLLQKHIHLRLVMLVLPLLFPTFHTFPSSVFHTSLWQLYFPYVLAASATAMAHSRQQHT